jgi:hypothetical protein
VSGCLAIQIAEAYFPLVALQVTAIIARHYQADSQPLHRPVVNLMNNCRKNLVSVSVSAIYVCLLILCTPVVAGEANEPAQPVDNAASETPPVTTEADEKHEDIVDKIFSPLDDAVSDINRDINKEDDSASPD